MRLWLLTRYATGTDEADGFVVRAPDEGEARRLASLRAGDEGSPAWLLPERSTCVELKLEGSRGVLLRSFIPG